MDASETGARLRTSVARSLLHNTLSNMGGQAVTMLVWLLLTPFILHRLGTSAYGLWALVGAFAVYGTLLDFGVGAAVTRFVAELLARGEAEEASHLVATALRIYSVLGAAVLVASVPIALLIPRAFDLPAELRDDARWVTLLTGVTLAIQLPANAAYAVLRGLQRFDVTNAIGIAATLVLAGSMVAVLELGGGVIGLAAVAIPVTVLSQIPMVMAVRRLAPDLHFGWRGAQRTMFRRVASFSSSLFVLNASTLIKTKTDEIVVAGALSVGQVAPYAIARRISDVPYLITYQFTRTLLPLASATHGAAGPGALRRLYIDTLRVTLAIYAPVGVVLAVLAAPLLTAWVGPEYATAANIVVILVGAGLVDIAMWPAASLLQASDGHRFVAVVSVLSAAVNLGLSVVLVRSMGITGVALGTLLAAAAETLLMVPYAARRFGVTLGALVREALTPTLLPLVVSVPLVIGLRSLLDPTSLAMVALIAVLGVVVHVAAFLSFRASMGERLALVGLVSQVHRELAGRG